MPIYPPANFTVNPLLPGLIAVTVFTITAIVTIRILMEKLPKLNVSDVAKEYETLEDRIVHAATTTELYKLEKDVDQFEEDHKSHAWVILVRH